MPVTIDTKALEQSTRELRSLLKEVGRQSKRASVSAINDTLRQMRTQSSKMVRESLNTKKKSADQRIRLTRANKKKPYGRLTFRDSPVFSISSFKPKQRKYGVAARIRKTQGITRLKGAFGPDVAKLKGGVYLRGGKQRFPIAVKPGISMFDEVKTRGIDRQMVSLAPDLFIKNYKRRLNLILIRRQQKAKRK